MGRFSFGQYLGDDDLKIEDADSEKIRAALALLHEAGVPGVISIGRTIVVNQCHDCGKAWLNENLTFLPGWYEQAPGRGRKVEIDKISEVLKQAGWDSEEIRCEPCTMLFAPRLADAIVTLDNTNLKRFFRVYMCRVKSCRNIRGFEDTLAYKFHVGVALALFKKLRAKNRTAFKAMSEIMHMLNLL